MSTLVVQLPSRPRLRARASGSDADSATEYAYALSPDGLALAKQGRCAVALLPKAASAVAVLADADVSWHRITLPKAPAARLQAALAGVLEEAMLEEASGMHLAVQPNAVAGEPAWVAAVDRTWLTAELALLEKAHVFIDRVVPMSWPDEPPSGHFAELGHSAADGVSLTWAHADGVAHLSLQGSLARSLLPTPLPEGARWTATPAAATIAERWLGAPVTVVDWPQQALLASRSLWNLRQFTLARKNRGTRALRDVWRQLLTPAWKPLRYGVVGLVAINLLGLNLWAAHQRRALIDKRQAMVRVLKTAHPHIRDVLDAPVQMQRETDTLRATAGKPGDTDLEPMLQAAASAWPGDRPPVDKVDFEPGRLTLSAAGWSPDQIEQFRSQLRPSGWQVEALEGRVVLTRLAANARATPERAL